jgi:DNA-directed RNA polymerase subunit RPC12/RpoP
MMHEPQPQPNTPTGRQHREIGEPCTGCAADVMAESVDGGLNCARCGQWQVLCDDCMPKVTEYAPDAVWCCPECREKTLDS